MGLRGRCCVVVREPPEIGGGIATDADFRQAEAAERAAATLGSELGGRDCGGPHHFVHTPGGGLDGLAKLGGELDLDAAMGEGEEEASPSQVEVEGFLQAEGLGTEATRAGIITMLQDRKYIDVKKNQVFATDKGKVLIRAIGDKILASPEMTAKWELRLSEIGQGKASASVFMEQTKKLSEKIIEDAVKTSSSWDFDGLNTSSIQRPNSKIPAGKSIGQCKLCEGNVIDKGQFYGCSNYSSSKCTFTVSKMILGKKVSETQTKKLLTNGQTDLIKGFKKGDNLFDARLQLSGDGKKVTFLIQPDQDNNEIANKLET